MSTQVASGPGTQFSVSEVEDGVDVVALQVAMQEVTSAAQIDTAALRRAGLPVRKKLKDGPKADTAFVNVLIDVAAKGGKTDDASTREAVHRIRELCENALDGRSAPQSAAKTITRNDQIAATVPVSFLADLETDPDIAFVNKSDVLKLDLPTPSEGIKPTPRRIGRASLHKDGADVIIGIIDVGGFDFAHPDFLDENGKTRFTRIWDQGGDFRPSPENFGFGSEFTQKHLNDAIDAQASGGLPAILIERQSQRSPSSHATHVASIAAGNSGVCPKAEIVGVLIDVPVPEDDFERRRHTFSDSSRLIHAVEYLLGIAKEKNKLVSINISLGTNGGAHDGLAGTNRWFENALTLPGRSITLAAGNAGQEDPQNEEDIGWIMGRIHAQGQIAARGLETELEWIVVGNGIADISENELEIWYSPQDRFQVELLPPGETRWLRVSPQEFIENKRLRDGTTVSIYNELFHPGNGGNYISIYLSPNLEPGEIRGIRAGLWRVRLIGEEVRNGKFHCWIERDDPREIGVLGGQRFFRFPSFFSRASNIDSHSISSLACGRATIAVSNYDTATNRMNVTSSQGPTRDGRMKPDLTAPGTDIVAANGFALDDETWVSMSGTSMASPYVAGVIGLMMNAAKKPINSLQCLGILQRTAKPLPGGTFDWVNDAGFGRIDPEAAIAEAENFARRTDRG
ncbi:S8 family serine peptidase [Leisingera sp. MMG026]|uniref:S8 family serine peptidase n=1 Tax=Leisingera sp. MMG026 TaxID=2909982 RepID=UPI001F01AF41|nr:S8 family serine peptidase [Leisingera sp. MMG026]MCF6432434.1 S8 family serine peptidase [Leisingera sp. MMG026]